MESTKLPQWVTAMLTELPATTERVADLLGLDDEIAAAGLAHLAEQRWITQLRGRGSRVWYPIGPAAADDPNRAISVRALALLPGTIRQLRERLPDLTGPKLSTALNEHRRAGRAELDGDVWRVRLAPGV